MKRMNNGCKSGSMALAAAVALIGVAGHVDAAITLNVIDSDTLTLTITEGIYDGIEEDFDTGLTGLVWGDVQSGSSAFSNFTSSFTFNGSPIGTYDGVFINFDSATGEVIGLNIGAALGEDPGAVNGGGLTASNFGFPPNTINSLDELDFSSLSTAPLTTGTFTGASEFITVVVVPEPSSAALLGLGALGMIVRRRRK